MRIYLDTNIFQFLAKSENHDFYELVLADKERNYYSFSEAHIQDLSRDKTNQKFSDMVFMETIVSKNCWYYVKDNMDVRFWSPREYYDACEWNDDSNIMTSDSQYSSSIRKLFSNIPLNWNQLININELPDNFPDDMRAVLFEPTTMLDFMEAMLTMTENLSEEQLRFKKLLQYSHYSMGEYTLFEKMGIKGFNGNEITDFEAFAESFKKLSYERSTQKDLYSLFVQMHHSLDLYGIVKGKPKKQKFISLLNDGKHSYYAGHANILVTRDVDMIAKSEVLFKVWNIETNVMTLEQFREYLENRTLEFNSVEKLFVEFEHAERLQIYFEKYTLDETFIQKLLPNLYLDYFNALAIATARGSTYYYFLQDFHTIHSKTLTIELERMVNKLVQHFGVDELGKGQFDWEEIKDKDWKGREWRIGEMGIIFRENNGMKLYFFKAAPIN